MKIRKGFVSNSSSSSFICDISGGSEGGYDVGLSDCGMVKCESGHTFYEHFLLPGFEEYKESSDDVNKKYSWVYGVPKEFCPICQMQTMSRDDVISVYLKKNNLSMESLAKQLKEEFGDYSTFKDFLIGK